MNLVAALTLCILVVTTGCGRFTKSSSLLGKNKEWCAKHLGEPVEIDGTGSLQKTTYLVDGIKVELQFNEKGHVDRITYSHDASLIPIPLTETEIQRLLSDNSDGKHWQLHDLKELEQANEKLAQLKLDREKYLKEHGRDLSMDLKDLDDSIETEELIAKYRGRDWTRKGASASCDKRRLILVIMSKGETP